MPTPLPRWLTLARSYIGVTEIPGPESHPTILDFVKNLGPNLAAYVKDDSTPWCATFVNHVLEKSGLPMSARPGSYDLLRAKSFLNYGTHLDIPARGAIVIFGPSKKSPHYHVGFAMGETLKSIRVLGGNQQNSVRDSWFAKDTCVAVRWPDPHTTPGDHFWLRPDGEPDLTTSDTR